MSDVPIRTLTVSDFRRIEGTRVLPFDAPVVLIHGPNGTGKTSVLSALELALTGEVKSMKRQDERYLAHLPFLGQAYAAVRADVAEDIRSGTAGANMTVGGTRVEGPRALNDEAAQFFAERCYLDQASLGRLLEFYQARVGKEESALAKFVSELLGLEKLDALRAGLSPANDLRLLKKLAVGVEDATSQAKRAEAELTDQSKLLAPLRAQIAEARAATREAVAAFYPATISEMGDTSLLAVVQSKLDDRVRPDAAAKAEEMHRGLLALGGRVSALTERPSTRKMQEIRTALNDAAAERRQWETINGAKVRSWNLGAQTAGFTLSAKTRVDIDEAAALVVADLASGRDIRKRVEKVRTEVDAERRELADLEARLADAHAHSSVLVESLAALRTLVEDSNICPVCDRNYGETGQQSLPRHIDTKLAQLAKHGQQIVDLRTMRDKAAARAAQAETEYKQMLSRVLTPEKMQALEERHAILLQLAERADEVEQAMSSDLRLAQRIRDHQRELEELAAVGSELKYIVGELVRYAALLNLDSTPHAESLETSWRQLLDKAEADVERSRRAASSYRAMALESSRLVDAIKRESDVVKSIAELTDQKMRWESRVAEAKHRQAVAKEVFEAATSARTAIIERVFTDSLNEVWRGVFTRLAPGEGFVPKFGIPTTTKTALEIKLETTHRTGAVGGPPQMMLSAGNLNTAALSLFLALHLAVQPIVPCLVFDDPVQAMDEVHVAQFAGLIRMLAKQHHRQVVIAVHERELFDYLTLELSPAFEGDQLITIELGDRANDEDEGITRHEWKPDTAIAS